MLTNIDLDEDLVATAMRLSGERTKRSVVHRALEELVRIERLRALRNARGTLKWEGNLGLLREEPPFAKATEGRRPAYGTARRHKRTD